MKSNQYYYCELGEAPRGPLPIQAINKAIAKGDISGAVNLSNTPAGPWAKLSCIDFSGHVSAEHLAVKMTLVRLMMVSCTLALIVVYIWITG